MPRIARTMIFDTIGGLVLGAGFLVTAGLLDRSGLALAILDLPVALAVPVVLGGLLPFAVGFAATGLALRSDPDSD